MRAMVWGLMAGWLLSGLPGAAKAELIFSNLGPGDSYNRKWGWAYGTTPRPVLFHDVAGAAFRAGGDFVVDKVEVALEWTFDHAQVDVQLAADAGGQPGAALETFHLTTGTERPTMVLLSAGSALHPRLTAGAAYWLVVSSPDTTGSWMWGNTTGPHFAAEDGRMLSVGTAEQGAFRISGHPVVGTVPAPPALLLGGFDVLGLCGYAWRRRRWQPTA